MARIESLTCLFIIRKHYIISIGVGMLGVILRIYHNHRMAQTAHQASVKHVLLPLTGMITVAMTGLTVEEFIYNQESLGVLGVIASLAILLCVVVPIATAVTNNESVSENCAVTCWSCCGGGDL